jgi:hypothetical protein
MNPLRTNPQHELHFVGNRPGLLKQKIDAPFRRVTPEKWRDTSFEFKPVLDRRYLDRHCGTEGRLTLRETPVSSRPQLKDSLTLLLNRLRKRTSFANERKCDDQHRGVGSHCALFLAAISGLGTATRGVQHSFTSRDFPR